VAAAAIISHRTAGRRAAGRLCRNWPELGLSYIQLVANAAGWICMVETTL